MMKKFEELVMNVVAFEGADVITSQQQQQQGSNQGEPQQPEPEQQE